MTLRIIVWLIAFVLPAVSLGVPVPHSLYFVIPALVAMDGLQSGGFQRLGVWILLSLLYEMMYQMPLGVFALSIAVMGLAHAGLSHRVRVDILVRTGRWKPVHVAHAFFVAVLWMTGLILASTLVGALVSDAPALSWSSLYYVWISRGAVFGSVGLLAIILGVLFWERTLRSERIFSDYATIQTTELSD